MGPFKDIGVEKTGHVALIEIRRPPNNFFDIALIQEIATALEALDENVDCRAVVLAAQGKAFCAGANFGDGTTLNKDGQREGELNREKAVQHLYIEGNRLFRTKKPIVAAVHGAAVGGGLGLAMVADFRVACPETHFSANFTRLGFHPGFGLTVTLPLVIGPTKAAMMFYTSRRVRGDEAYRHGPCRRAGAAGPGARSGDEARRRDRREFAARADRDTHHHARRSRRPRAEGDRARAERTDLPAQDRRLQGRRQGDGRAPAAEFHRPLMASQGRRMGSPFWNFSLAVYGANAVQHECLDLQDRFGLDVNLILLCAFLGAVHGVALTPDDIAAARETVRQWQEQVVRPLRAARRNLKSVELQDSQDANGRNAIACASQSRRARIRIYRAVACSNNGPRRGLQRGRVAMRATPCRQTCKHFSPPMASATERLAAAQSIIAAALDRTVIE